MPVITIFRFSIGLLFLFSVSCSSPSDPRIGDHFPIDHQLSWDSIQAQQWYHQKGWLVGCNFIPSNAINQLEMWQPTTFDTATINRELHWAQAIGFNAVRAYLHDLPWLQDSIGFLNRIEQYLTIAHRRGIGTIFVVLDGVWDPQPKSGKQPAPRPHIHNSGWVQSPGAKILADTAQWYLVEKYIKGVVSHFSQDNRIIAWDVFNEPDNTNPAYQDTELTQKEVLSFELLRKAFGWIREANPSQPITSAPWKAWLNNWEDISKMTEIDRFMFENSDIITFHCYEPSEVFKKQALYLKQFGKPILCTEYLARGRENTFQELLPFLQENNIGAFNWGLVSGKTQTIYPWKSWDSTFTTEPDVWHHDILRTDGTAYDSSEIYLIKKLTDKDL